MQTEKHRTSVQFFFAKAEEKMWLNNKFAQRYEKLLITRRSGGHQIPTGKAIERNLRMKNTPRFTSRNMADFAYLLIGIQTFNLLRRRRIDARTRKKNATVVAQIIDSQWHKIIGFACNIKRLFRQRNIIARLTFEL